MKEKVNPEVLIFSDLHAKLENLETVGNIFNEIKETCRRLKIRDVIFAGDMFHERAAQSLEVLNFIRFSLKDLKKNEINIYTIHGNHDQKDQNSKVSYLLLYNNLVKHFPTFGQAKIRSNNFQFLSFFKDNDLYRKYLSELKRTIKPQTILITHKDFNGAKNNDGTVVENGIGLKEVKEYKEVLVGHYHNRNKLGSNLYYFGAAFQHNFGEDEEKGFLIINEDGSYNTLNSNFPRYIKRKLLLEETTKEDCRKISEEFKGSKDKIRVVFYGENYDINKVDKELLNEAGIDVKFENSNKILEDDFKIETSLDTPLKQNKKSILKSFLAYAKGNNFTPSQTTNFLKLIQSKL